MTGTKKRAPKKTAVVEVPVEPWSHDFLMLKTTGPNGWVRGTGANGRAYEFHWPAEVGAMVEAPDWNPEPVCGGGLHGLADGLGDWGLMRAPADQEARWYVLGAKRSEAIQIDEAKVKVPRCRVIYIGDIAGAMQLISPAMSSAIIERVKVRTAAAIPEGEKATGGQGAASATGGKGAASATGGQGAASATGWQGAASATGDACVALAAGKDCRGRVGDGCLLVLVERDEKGAIVNHFAALAGEKGVQPDSWYTLRNGLLVEVAADGGELPKAPGA